MEGFIKNLAKNLQRNFDATAELFFHYHLVPDHRKKFIELLLGKEASQVIIPNVIKYLATHMADFTPEAKRKAEDILAILVEYAAFEASMHDNGVLLNTYVRRLPVYLTSDTGFAHTCEELDIMLYRYKAELIRAMLNEANIDATHQALALLTVWMQSKKGASRRRVMNILIQLAFYTDLHSAMLKSDLLPSVLEIFKVNFTPYYNLNKAAVKITLQLQESLRHTLIDCTILLQLLLKFSHQEDEAKKEPIREEILTFVRDQGIKFPREFPEPSDPEACYGSLRSWFQNTISTFPYKVDLRALYASSQAASPVSTPSSAAENPSATTFELHCDARKEGSSNASPPGVKATAASTGL